MVTKNRILSEFVSKNLLRDVGVPVAQEKLTLDREGAVVAAAHLGFPVVLKLCADGLAHKTERNLVRLGLSDENSVRVAAEELLELREPGEESAALLVQELVSGRRELIAGMIRDPQFGPCVMLGLGGIFAEALSDVVFRVAPLAQVDPEEMIDELTGSAILGEFRGEPAVDRHVLARVLMAIGRLGLERPEIVSIDVNPLIISGGQPIAVDAVVEVSE